MTMNDQLKQLIELQKVDAAILLIQRTLDNIPKKIREVEFPLNEAESHLKRVQETLDDLEKRKRDKEHELDDITERIDKIKSRVTEIKTNKEYQAHLKEIESVEKERSQIEDEILVIMEEIESASQKVEKEKNIMKQNKEKVDLKKNELDAEKMQSEKEMDAKREIRSHIAASIDEDLYREYISILESRGGSAVFEAQAEICQGCNMNIPPQLFVEVKRNERIIHCPQCHRILFFKNDQ